MRKLAVICAVMGLMAVVGVVQADIMWSSSSPDWLVGGPEIFKVDTFSGQVVTGSKWSYSELNWIMSIADSGDYLYVAADKLSDAGSFPIVKINRSTGAIVSETDVASLLGRNYSHINALEYFNGKLYGVENCTWDTTYRGNIIEMTLDSITGDVTGASVGAYIGGYPAPDGALDFYNGSFYASDWKSGGDPGVSWIATIGAADIGDNTKNFDETLFTNPASGLMDGWQFDMNGDLIAVSWQNTGLYKIDHLTGVTTTLYSSIGGVTSGHTMSGLDAVVPEPLTMLGLFFGLGSVGAYIRKRRMV